MPSPSSLSLLSAAVWPTSDIALLLRGWWDLLFPPTCLASAQGSVAYWSCLLNCDWLSPLPPLLSPAGGKGIAFNSLFTSRIAPARCFQGPYSHRL